MKRVRIGCSGWNYKDWREVFYPKGLPQARELYGRALALVRPDQYIAWRGDRLPDDVDVLLARVTGL